MDVIRELKGVAIAFAAAVALALMALGVLLLDEGPQWVAQGFVGVVGVLWVIAYVVYWLVRLHKRRPS